MAKFHTCVLVDSANFLLRLFAAPFSSQSIICLKQFRYSILTWKIITLSFLLMFIVVSRFESCLKLWRWIIMFTVNDCRFEGNCNLPCIISDYFFEQLLMLICYLVDWGRETDNREGDRGGERTSIFDDRYIEDLSCKAYGYMITEHIVAWVSLMTNDVLALYKRYRTGLRFMKTEDQGSKMKKSPISFIYLQFIGA